MGKVDVEIYEEMVVWVLEVEVHSDEIQIIAESSLEQVPVLSEAKMDNVEVQVGERVIVEVVVSMRKMRKWMLMVDSLLEDAVQRVIGKKSLMNSSDVGASEMWREISLLDV